MIAGVLEIMLAFEVENLPKTGRARARALARTRGNDSDELRID
jgi:hypothetical protein